MNLQFKNLIRLSTAGFALYSPISILAYPVSLLVVNPGASPLQLLLLGVILTMLSFMFYFPLMKLHNKYAIKPSTFAVSFFISIIAATGAFRGVLFYYFDSIFNYEQPSSFLNRVLASMLTSIFWLTASNVVINISRSFRSKYQSTLNQYLAAHLSAGTTDIKLTPEFLEFTDLRKDLTNSLINLLESGTPESFGEESEKLTLQINEQLRPLSRRIWLRSLNEYPVINVKILIRDSLAALTFSRKLFILVMFFLALLNNLFLRSIGESLWRTGSYLLATYLILFFVDKFHLLGKNIGRNILIISLISIIPIYLSEFLAGFLGFNQNFLATALITPVPVAVIVVLSFIDLSNSDRSFLLSLLEEKSSEIYAETSKGIDHNKRQLASYLHNTFQSELLALSQQLAAAALTRDKDKTAKVLQRVSAVANRSLSEDLSRMNQKPLERLESVVLSWENLLTIDIQIENDFLNEHLDRITFIQTLEEVATNAFRHDRATRLTVTAEMGEVGVRVSFQSNGTQPLSKSKGLGTLWLNQVSLTPWSIEKNGLGTQIVVEI